MQIKNPPGKVPVNFQLAATRLGFTLSEILVTLAILGVIATFTIPKVLATQQDVKFKSISKEVIATVSQAYQEYLRSKSITSSAGIKDLTNYINYVVVDTSRRIDNTPPGSYFDCSLTNPCLSSIVAPRWYTIPPIRLEVRLQPMPCILIWIPMGPIAEPPMVPVKRCACSSIRTEG
jgi:prepilin-type N-terminal cleavage/methylation domain-containing protein